MHTENTCCDLNEFGLLSISGNDASKLLQGQITIDVTKLLPGKAKLAAICNPQGRVLSLFIIFTQNNQFYLLLPRSMVDLTLAAFKKYAGFYKVNLSDESENLATLGLSLHVGGSPPLNSNIMTIAFFSQFFLIGPKNDIAACQKKLLESSQLIDYPTWKYQLLLEGIPIIYPETTGQFLPHELNLPLLGAISFDKGCYTGQEIIARMEYRGKLKTHLYRTQITTAAAILPGTAIYTRENAEMQECGYVVDSASTVYHETIALIITAEKYARSDSVCLKQDNSFFTFLDTVSEK